MKDQNQHITYCTNIHSGENWEEHFAELRKHFPAVKKGISPGAAMGIGLRLSNQASLDLLQAKKLDELKAWLAENDAYVFTMNGFPYGAFHQQVVKEKVHHPDWTTNDRLEYTLRLFDILAELLPDGIDGGISTSPLSYRYWFKSEADRLAAVEKATLNIVRVAERLATLKATTGKLLHLDIEPEPDGLLESGPEFIDWYENDLIRAGRKYLSGKNGFGDQEVDAMLKEHICLCYDVCHFAVGYEDHATVVETLESRGIRTGKIQVSAALQVPLTDVNNRKELAATLSGYNESVYLHQVIARLKNNELTRFRDLGDALPHITDEDMQEWRIHFHVPIFLAQMHLLQSTQQDICNVLDLQKTVPFTNHIEVETYTWEVLPGELKLDIDQSIVRELSWMMQYLRK